MATVVLHGDLASFGGPYVFAADTIADIFSALSNQLKGFRKRLYAGDFRVVRRNAGKESDVSAMQLRHKLPSDAEIHVTPVVVGSGKNTGKMAVGGIILAGALIAAAPLAGAFMGGTGATAGSSFAAAMSSSAFTVAGFGITYSQIAGFGLMMILGGAARILSNQSNDNSIGTTQAENPSYLFNNNLNTTRQGSARPLLYGEFFCDPPVISYDLVAERLI